MRFSMLLVIFTVCGAFPAMASPKWGPLPWIFPYWGWDQQLTTRPYLENGKTPHNSQWENDAWTPQDWIEAKGSARAVMDGLYRNHVIIDKDLDDDVPEVEVGQNFMRLSGQEKRRVAAFVDHAYKITNKSPGMYVLVHAASDDPVGVYTKQGLQLQ